MYVMADSFCYTVETNIVKQLFHNKYFKKIYMKKGEK